MLETGKMDSIGKKSYEISYALWRIAKNIPEKSFSEKLADKAIDLIGSVLDGNSDLIAAKLPGIELFVKFGVDINCITVANGEILHKEIGNLKSAIFDLNAASSLDDLVRPDKAYQVDIADIFSEEELPETEIDISGSDASSKYDSRPKTANQNKNGSMKSETRQSAILERIRQIGNCRLNDIQAILPDCSERTIRYDLESLVQRKMIERVGTGGRSVYYRMPDEKTPDSN